MARLSRRDRVDRELDLHGMSRTEAREALESPWSRREWHGLCRIRVIHGCGAVLHATVRRWCDEKGIVWTTESTNPGVTIILPGQRLQTAAPPPVRPLQGLRRALAASGAVAGGEPASRTIPSDDPPVDSEPESPPRDGVDLMAAEFRRLDREHPAATRSRKLGGAGS